MSEQSKTTRSDILALTARIVAAHVANNPFPAGALPNLILTVCKALAELGLVQGQRPVVPQQQPAVPVKRSVQPDFLVCLEDGAKVIMLKRYLLRRFDLTPDGYRAKWGLPADYPMVAPNYAARRSTLAKQLGLGRKRLAPKVGASEANEVGPAENTGSAEERLFPADLADEAEVGRHTAESVFGSFGKGDHGSAEDMGNEVVQVLDDAPSRKRGRKPFAERSVRAARKGRPPKTA